MSATHEDELELTPHLVKHNPKLAMRLVKDQMAREHPLRRVQVACCGRWIMDPLTEVGDWLWVQEHNPGCENEGGALVEVTAVKG